MSDLEKTTIDSSSMFELQAIARMLSGKNLFKGDINVG